LFEDKINFIKRHRDEIRPLTKNPDFVDNVSDGQLDGVEKKIDSVLEEFENKLFVCEKTEHNKEAKRVLITVDNPGPYTTVKTIVEALLKDERCKSIAIITGGVSSKSFANQFGSQFQLVRNDDKLFWDDLAVFSEDNPVDVTIASVSEKNGPESVALWSGKPILGAKKTFLVFSEWGTLGNNFSERLKESAEGKEAIAQIDGIFCNDDLAKRIVMNNLPDFPPDKIFDTGTPSLDSLNLPQAEELRRLGREKLGLTADDFTVIYVGDCSNYPEYGCKPELNVRTFEQSLGAIIKLAEENPDLKLAFLLRPHPRDPDKERLYEFAKRVKLPPNLKFVSANREVVSMNEAAYAADVATSIISTENILAPLRGNFSIFLGFKENGMGERVIKSVYPPDILTAIKETRGIYIADSPEDLARIVSGLKKKPDERPAVKVLAGEPTNKILDKIFE
jgi:hypothetical protein